MNNEMNNNTPNVDNANNNVEPIVNEVPNQSISDFNNNVNVVSNSNNTLLEDNIVVEKKKNKTPIIIIVVVLLVILIGVVVYMFFFNNKKLSSKDVYYNALDSVNNYLVGNVNNIKDENTKMTHDLAFNIVSSDTDSEEVVNILNALKLKLDLEVNPSDKLLVGKIDANYKNNPLVSVEGIINNSDMYLGLGNLYAKYIKGSEPALSKLWEYKEDINYEAVDKEIINIIKKNLKEEYFTEEKNKNETKYTLTINNMEEFINNIINDIENNDVILNEIVKISDEITKDDIIKVLDGIKIEDIENPTKFIADTYLNNKNEVLKIDLNFNDDYHLLIEKENDKYNITAKSEEVSVKIAELKIEDKYIEISSNIDGYSLLVKFDQRNNSNNFEIDFKTLCTNCTENDTNCIGNCRQIEINITNTGTSDSGELKLAINVDGEKVEVTDNYSLSKELKFNKDALNNFINYEEVNVNEIWNNVCQNKDLIYVLDTLELNSFDCNEVDTLLDEACTKRVDGTYNEESNGLLVECRNGMCRATDTESKTILGTKSCE